MSPLAFAKSWGPKQAFRRKFDPIASLRHSRTFVRILLVFQTARLK